MRSIPQLDNYRGWETKVLNWSWQNLAETLVDAHADVALYSALFEVPYNFPVTQLDYFTDPPAMKLNAMLVRHNLGAHLTAGSADTTNRNGKCVICGERAT
jgi:hypothetical protein